MNPRRSPRNHPEPRIKVHDINNQEIKEHDIVQFETNYHGLLGARGRVEHIDCIIIGIDVIRGNTYSNNRPYKTTEFRKSTNVRIIKYEGAQEVRQLKGLQPHEVREQDRNTKVRAR